jgi:O-antigen/teichoic acid export membrane protein
VFSEFSVIKKYWSKIHDEGAKGRTIRSSFWSIVALFGENAVRLISNLIMTRILFPEAFGLMAIVHVFISGLQMFSDTGIRVSILQNPKGDDVDFLNTAWTIQAGRGVLLWLGTCVLALPVAAIYDEPLLAQLLPVAGLQAVIAGLQPTKVLTANRHLRIGRQTMLGLFGGLCTVAATATLGLLWQSVWALVFGGLIGMTIRQFLMRRFLPGIRNRFRWDPAAAGELFHFGKYIFAATMFGFFVNHADRAIIGAFVPLAVFGVYTIAFLFANLPYAVAHKLTNRVILPLYRMRPMAERDSNRRHIYNIRRAVVGVSLAGNAVIGLIGVPLIDLLYDERYALGGPILVLLCLVFVPRIVFVGAGQVLLAHGDSRRHLIYTGSLAILQTTLLLLGAWRFGIVGAIVAPAVALLLISPLRIHYARVYEGWDAWGEALFLALGLLIGATTCWLHWGDLQALSF